MLISSSLLLLVFALNAPAVLCAKTKKSRKPKESASTRNAAHIPRDTPSLNDVAQAFIASGKQEDSEASRHLQDKITEADLALKQATQAMAATLASQADSIRLETERKTNTLLHEASAKSAALLHQAHGHVMQLKRKAAQQIEMLITQSEEDALKNRKQRRLGVLDAALHPLDDAQAWKIAFKKDFYEALEYIEAIITSHEEPGQVEEFMRLFSNQKKWFDDALEKTTDAQDPTYFSLTQKALFFTNLARAYQQAEALLSKSLPNSTQPSIVLARLRLMIFYELNDLLQQSATQSTLLSGPMLTDREIKHVVTEVLYKARSEKNIAIYLQELINNQASLKQELVSTQEALQTTAQTTAIKTQATFIPKLEAATKESFELQSIILDTKAQLEKASGQAIEAQAKLQKTEEEAADLRNQIIKQKKSESDSAAQVYALEEFNKKLIEEDALHFDLKKTLHTEILTHPTPKQSNPALQPETPQVSVTPEASRNYIEAEAQARSLLDAELATLIQAQLAK
jgi:hypothetical protein